MRIYRLEQNSEVWLEERRGKITGTKTKVGHQARNKTKRYVGFYTVLAEKLSIAKDGEDAQDRGHRLEPDALKRLAKERNLQIDDEPGMWISDVDDDISVSPDGAEVVEGDKLPTFGVEVKALESHSHLRYMLEDRERQKQPDYNPIMSVPNEESHQYREQVLQYFVVNEALETMYFCLYDDRFVFDHLILHTIVIRRSDVADMVRAQMAVEYEALIEINKLVKELTEV